ncbi:hypothetical protein U1Q18_051018 [Sarracenia purpurea var. burkii]
MTIRDRFGGTQCIIFAFHKCANQGFYKNKFEGLIFQNNLVAKGGEASISGEEILRNTWQVEMGCSKWVDLGIVLGMVVLYRLMFLGILKSVEKINPIMRSIMSSPFNNLHMWRFLAHHESFKSGIWFGFEANSSICLWVRNENVLNKVHSNLSKINELLV